MTFDDIYQISIIHQIPSWYLFLLIVIGILSTILLLRLLIMNMISVEPQLYIGLYSSLLGVLLNLIFSLGNLFIIQTIKVDFQSKSDFICQTFQFLLKYFNYFAIYQHLSIGFIYYLLIKQVKITVFAVWTLWVISNMILAILSFATLVSTEIRTVQSIKICESYSSRMENFDLILIYILPTLLVLFMIMPLECLDFDSLSLANLQNRFVNKRSNANKLNLSSHIFTKNFIIRENILFLLTHTPMLIFTLQNVIYKTKSERIGVYKGICVALTFTYYSLYSMIEICFNPQLFLVLFTNQLKKKTGRLKNGKKLEIHKRQSLDSVHHYKGDEINNSILDDESLKTDGKNKHSNILEDSIANKEILNENPNQIKVLLNNKYLIGDDIEDVESSVSCYMNLLKSNEKINKNKLIKEDSTSTMNRNKKFKLTKRFDRPKSDPVDYGIIQQNFVTQSQHLTIENENILLKENLKTNNPKNIVSAYANTKETKNNNFS